MSEAILKINNIEVKYHEVILVLKGVSIEVPKGGIVALLGANGAGKSTTLKAVSGLLKTEDGEVTDGAIEYEGRRIHHERAANIAKLGDRAGHRGPAGLRAPDRGGEPQGGGPPQEDRLGQRGPGHGLPLLSRACARSAMRSPALSAAASSR